MRSRIRSEIISVFTNPYFHTATVRIRVMKKPDRYIDSNRTIPDYLYRVRVYK